MEITVNKYNRMLLSRFGRCVALDVHLAREMIGVGSGQNVEGLHLVGDSVQAQGRPGRFLGGTGHSCRSFLALTLHRWQWRSQTS